MSRKNENMKNEILSYIAEHTEQYGYPPSVREICTKVGLSSPSTVHGYLARMEKEGLIERDSTKTRAIRVKNEDSKLKNVTKAPIDKSEIGTEEFIEVPVIGNVAAGMPITAQEQVTDVFPLPSRFAGKGEGTFMLRVKGESMINAGIFDGDLVIVSRQQTAANGEIIVALVDDSATVKTFYNDNGVIRLQPENDDMEPIYPENMSVIGKVVGLFRTM